MMRSANSVTVSIPRSLLSEGFRSIIENMTHTSTQHEVLAVVFQVRDLGSGKPDLDVLLWQRALEPELGKWSLPGGQVRDDEDLSTSVRRQLAEKVDLREVAHIEQLAVFSELRRVPARGSSPRRSWAWCPPRHSRVAARHPLAPGAWATPDGFRPRAHGGLRPFPAGPNCPTPTSDLPWRQGNSRSRHCATSTAQRSATRSTPPICSGCWAGAGSSHGPARRSIPAAAADAGGAVPLHGFPPPGHRRVRR